MDRVAPASTTALRPIGIEVKIVRKEEWHPNVASPLASHCLGNYEPEIHVAQIVGGQANSALG